MDSSGSNYKKDFGADKLISVKWAKIQNVFTERAAGMSKVQSDLFWNELSLDILNDLRSCIKNCRINNM